MSAARLSLAVCASAALAPAAFAQEAFVTQLRLPAREKAADVIAWRDGGEVLVEAVALESLGIVAGARTNRVSLRSVPGLSFVEELGAGAIVITCSAACFSTQRVGATADQPRLHDTPWGGYVNYDAALDWRERRGAGFGAVLETDLFGPLGRGEASWLARSDDGITRLETRWTIDDPARALRLRIGDSARPSLDGGVTWFGGVQIGRHFALAPHRVTYPTPRLSGVAESASTVDLYIDGALRARGAVEAGPFELTEAPYIAGAGEAQLVVTDVLGREQIVTRPFFVSTAMLKPGLSDWNLAAGWDREELDAERSRYGAPSVAGQYRVGLNDHVTAEVAAEWREQGGAVQLGASLAHHTFGLLQLRHARDAGGGATSFSWSRQARALSFGVQADWRDDAFGAVREDRMARSRVAAHAALNLGERGDVSFAAATARYHSAREARAYTLTYAPDYDRVGVQLRLSYVEREETDVSVGVGLTLPLDGDVSASAGAEWDRRGAAYRVAAQRAARADVMGWRTRASVGARTRIDAAIVHAGSHAELRAQAGYASDTAALRAEARGAVGWIGPHVFAGRAIQGAFALVDTGAPGVAVTRDRLPVGQSGPDGLILAANLRANDVNLIGIDADTLPLDRAPSVLTHRAAPAEGAGAIVRFTGLSEQLTQVRVQWAGGADAPRGAVLVRERDSARFPIGAAGRVVLRGARVGDALRLESDARCIARVEEAEGVLILNCAAAA